jgi:hypothetical protein
MTAMEATVAPEQRRTSQKMKTSCDHCWRHQRGAFNNQQGWEAARWKVVGGHGRDILDGRRKAVGVGLCNVQRRKFSGGIRYSAATNNVVENNNRGGTALLTPASAAASRPLPPHPGRRQQRWRGWQQRLHRPRQSNWRGPPWSLCLTGPNCHHHRLCPPWVCCHHPQMRRRMHF